MSSSYESSYHKIASVDELPIGKPRAFRAAGATVVLRRSDDGVTAIDGSYLSDDRDILDTEWKELQQRAGLAVRIESGAVWVCLEGCRNDE